MGARIDVRIDSDRDRRFNPVGSGNMADSFKFGFRFNVETMNPCREGLLDFPDGFAQTRKNDLARVPPAATTRFSSPPETMSNPAPSRAKTFSTARLELAFTAKHTKAETPDSAS